MRHTPTCCGGRPREPNLKEAERFANEIHKQFPGKMLAYNCSPSFNWEKKLPAKDIAAFQREIGKMGYRFQFVTLAGFHSLNLSMFNLARGYKDRGMAAYSEMQQAEFAAEAGGLHRDPASAGSGRRVLRRGCDGDLGRQVVHDGVRRVDRGGSVPRPWRDDRGARPP